MRRLPWHVSLRADRRGIVTSLGVALGVAFALVSFAIPHGLDVASVEAGGILSSPHLVVARADASELDPREIGAEGAIVVRHVSLETAERGVVLFVALDGVALAIAHDEYLPVAEHDRWPAILVVQGAALRKADVPRPSLAPRDAAIVLPATHAALGPVADAHYLLVPEAAEAQVEGWIRAGLVVAPAPAAEPFLRLSTAEIVRDLFLVVAFGAVFVALLTYEFLHAEIRDRRREIGIWRSLGMTRPEVLVLLLTRAAFVSVAGASVGGALSVVALSLASRVTGNAALFSEISGATVVAVLAIFVAAGLLGTIVPAFQAASRPIQASLEAPR